MKFCELCRAAGLEPVTTCFAREHIEKLLDIGFRTIKVASYDCASFQMLRELKNVFDNSGSKDEWNNFIKYISTDERIGNSHMSVPGHDGKEGFGGACLPKDTNALYKYAESKGIHLSLIEKVLKLNNNLRDKYNKDEREISQNIKYKE